MAEYKQGTVATATVDGIEGVRVMRGQSIYGDPFWNLDRKLAVNGRAQSYAEDDAVTDVRPLVVLDLDGTYGCWADQGNPAAIVKSLRETNSAPALAIADQIEAQTKPPRIPEPGKYGVVLAGVGCFRSEFVNEGKFWRGLDAGHNVAWDELENPKLVRPGI